ncbi:hypothetical protein C8Q78DRAFT_504427 [Trametes maxima]|nr:hypothetical protein C8Q78DRAFT_504427 [Trametes maxima]
MTIPTQKHVVAFSLQAWGHARPLINLSARFVKLRQHVVVTFLVADAFYDRTHQQNVISSESTESTDQNYQTFSDFFRHSRSAQTFPESSELSEPQILSDEIVSLSNKSHKIDHIINKPP